MIPFSNGTEEQAWMGVWCQHCAHDHEMHTEEGPGCDICLFFLDPTTLPWPEALLPEHPSERHLPSLMVCAAFTPCADCGGDPLAETRAAAVAHTQALWREHPHG